MTEVVELYPVDEEVLLKHERVLVKQILLIFPEDELMQGPLNKNPRKSVVVPDYTGTDKVKDEARLAYRMVQTDPLGERKISVAGDFLGGREYLCETFRLREVSDRLVLIPHLIKALNYDGGEDEFLREFDQILATDATSEVRDSFINQGILPESVGNVKYVSFKSAFVQFGAALVAGGIRVLDDYWETIAKGQGLTAHHRVFKLSKRLGDKLKILKPHVFSETTESQQTTEQTAEHGRLFESPWTTVTEQPSLDARQQWGKEFTYGEHINVVVPGQSIHGSLDLSAQYKIPKYHSKNSFQLAVQMKALDLPIDSKVYSESKLALAKQENTSDTPHPGKKSSRILNSILDTGTSSKMKKEYQEESTGHEATNSFDESLNINGWKFDSLPLRSPGVTESQRSIKGLPFYDQAKLIARAKKLTPNQVKKLEHVHDSVFLNAGLQNVRGIRSQKWSKYWQYKSGVPVGLLNSEIKYFQHHYLKEVLEQTSSVTNYIPEANVDEIDTTTRVANANYIGYCNIHSFRPPYMS